MFNNEHFTETLGAYRTWKSYVNFHISVTTEIKKKIKIERFS